MQPPDNIKRGQPLVEAVRNKLDEICAYLRATKLVKGKGILVKETSAGTIVSMIQDRSSLDEEEEGEAAAVEYSGPFAVRVTTPPPEEEEEESETIGTEEEEEEDEGPGVYVTVAAGVVVTGNTRLAVPAAQDDPIFLPEGHTLWLVGKYTTPYSFSYAASDSAPSVLIGRFSLAIAKNTGGVIQQIQFGEVLNVTWGNSNSFWYVGPFAVELQGGTSARIYNRVSGADPLYAGEVKIGNSVHSVPVASLPITPGYADDIYLTVYYDAEDNPPGLKYEFSKTLSDAVTGNQGWYKRIASVNANGVVTQLHMSGDIEIAGRWI